MLALGEGLYLIETERFRFRLVFGDDLRFGLDRGVHGVVPQIEEEGSVVFVAHQIERLIGQVIGQIGAFGHVGVFEWRNGPGAKITTAPRRALVRPADIDFEAVIFGKVAVGT